MFSCVFCVNAEGSKKAEKLVVPVYLKGLVREVIERNLKLSIQRTQAKIYDSRMTYELGIFDPQFRASVNLHDTKSPNNTSETLSRGGLETHEETQWSYKTGISGLLENGTEWDVEYMQSETQNSLIDSLRSYEHEFQSRVQLSVRQPLLKGFGSENVLAEYNKAGIDKEITNQSYKSLVMKLTGAAIREFMLLKGANSLADSLRNSIKLLTEGEAILKKKLASGEVAARELLEARSSLLSRQVELSKILDKLERSKYKMAKLLNLSLADLKDISFHPESAAVVTVEPISFHKSLENMKNNWPQYKIAQAKYARAEVDYKKKLNDSRPSLDLVAKTWVSSLDDEAITGEFRNDDFLSWQVGLELSIPLTGKREKSSVTMARLAMEQAELEIEDLDLESKIALRVELQTMKALRSQQSAIQNVLELKQQLLDEEMKRFRYGEIEIGVLIKKEDEVTNYHREMLNQTIKAELSQVSLDMMTGVIVKKYYDGDLSLIKLDTDQKKSGLNSETFK
ncbi:MAG: TolC family protein [Lentisphaeraceae bacterium]|nr:TolC family protein [Lentisphaeraceae bacterium]